MADELSRTIDRCHWAREADGTTTLIPMCWARVNDPDADCCCGRWSEETAAAAIKGLRQVIYRQQSELQALRRTMRAAGIETPSAEMLGPKEYNARRKRKALHRAITEMEAVR